ncbi:MAG: purine-nucleoside phosphorylase, partial [Acidobacteria bacterium]|nr:purine-nucleoside phosphorylase [Acidobacteriota bacterium]
MNATTAFLRGRVGSREPRVGIVLGSGLGGLADAVEESLVVRYADIPGFPDSSVAGHRGELVFGRIGETEVVLQAGRFHLYEGHDPQTVVLPVRTFAELGVETLIVTNVAGGICPTFSPPVLML